MKKLLLLTILLCTSLLQTRAFEWTDTNGVTWTVSQNNYYYSGSYHYYYTITAAANYGDEVVVPQTVYNGETPYTIEAIGSNLFYNNKTLSAVTLPSTIKYINYNAFQDCTALTTVGDISNCEYIYDNAFRSCSNLASVDLSSCTNVGYYAFYQCSVLSSIGSLAACTNIGYGAFRCCSNLQAVDLSANTSIGGEAFYGCSSLQSVGSLQGASIGNYAFCNCTSLTSVDISQAASLGAYAFSGCTNLTSVGDLSAYTAIDNYVFYECSKLESVNLSNCKSIGNYAFYYCSALESVDLSKVTSMGTYAFYNCTSLKDVGDISAFTSIPNGLFYGTKMKNLNLPNVTSVGYRAFAYCDSLTSISLPECTTITGTNSANDGAFRRCTSLSSIHLPKVTSVGDYAFYECTSLAEIGLPKVTSIGNSAFNGCSYLTEPNITSTDLIYVGSSAFNVPGTVTLMTTTPPTLSSNYPFGSMMVVRVPDAAVADYRAAEYWSDFANRIVGIGTQIDYDVEVSAGDNHSALNDTIGEEHLQNVVSLKITGTINSYDIMVMRNKMDNLHYLDLSDANIVANSYEYYTGFHTEDNVLGGNSFYNLQKLLGVKLPKTITSIGDYAFENCQNLKDVEFQTGLKSIEYGAFRNCRNLKSINLKDGLETIGSYAFGNDYSASGQPQEEELIIPNGVTSIGYCAFGNNRNLKRVYFPSSLKTMGEGAFRDCNQLESISLPTSLENIPSSAFSGCSNLTRVDIPSTITSIGGSAFNNCSQLNDVYTYIVEPTHIEMNTFSDYIKPTLHVPSTSYYNYYYDTEWSQFRNLEEFIAEYQYFYINNDFTISDEQGTINGGVGEDDPNADLNGGSGLIVETDENNPQQLNEIHIKAKGSDVASVITASNLIANKVFFDIEIQAGRWYFLSFPFNVKITDETIQAPGKYVFRTYDPNERANGKTGWQNWIGDLLYKGQGYIFQCAKGGTLSVCVEKDDEETPVNWDAEDRSVALQSAPAENAQDASWNFLGNPQTSYVDIDATGYTQPITVWNNDTQNYDAIRAADDDYALAPFEAFFVQKSDNTSEMEFPEDGRFTKTQWQQELTEKAAARRLEGVKTDRLMVNMELSDGEHTDKTRVVFNEKASKNYETACDAAKFLSQDIPQLYTLDQRQGRYAINERPTGEVRLGYVAKTKGELTIKAERMDQPMLLRDNLLQITHNLSLGEYTFSTEKGTFNNRFMLVVDGSATSVGKLREDTGVSALAEKGGISFSGIEGQEVSVYSMSGTMLAGHVGNGIIKLPAATYVVKVNNVSTKLIVR